MNEEKDQKSIMNEVNRVPMTEASRSKMNLNIYDLQWLIRLQDMRDAVIKEEDKEEMKKFLMEIYIQDNERTCKIVTDVVSKQLAETLVPFYKKLESLEIGQDALSKGQKNIATDVSIIKEDIASIKKRLDDVEDKVEFDEKQISQFERRLNDKRKRIENIEETIKELQPEPIKELVKEVHNLRPTVIKLTKTQRWWNIALRIVIGVVIAVAFAVIYFENRSKDIVKDTVYQTLKEIKIDEVK